MAYVTVDRQTAIEADRRFIGFAGHHFLCTSVSEADEMFERLSNPKIPTAPRWEIWVEAS